MTRTPLFLCNYFVTSARFDGQGRGFVIGFVDERPAYLFAKYILFGFAEVMPWHIFHKRYPDYLWK